MRTSLLILAVFFCCVSAIAQTAPQHSPVPLDQYGGRMDINCTNTTGHFILEKLGNRWWFCDALGHPYIGLGVSGTGWEGGNPDCSGFTNTSTPPTAKYGSSHALGSWDWASLLRMRDWGFNAQGVDYGLPTPDDSTSPGNGWPGNISPIDIPYEPEVKPMQDMSSNRFGLVVQPQHDLDQGTDTNSYTAFRGDALFDVFDPNIEIELSSELSQFASDAAIRANSPWILGVWVEDSDWFFGSGVSPDFGNVPGGKGPAPSVAWVTLVTAPYVSYIPVVHAFCAYSNCQFVTPDGLIRAKDLVLNPVTTCSIANPCSLRDYLWQKYGGTIGTLNTAWGSNYTTFDSSQTAVNGETVSTPASYTFAHTNVTPNHIYCVLTPSGGSPVDVCGDCPQFELICGGGAGTGQLMMPMTWNASQAYCGKGTSTCNPNNQQGMLIVDSNGCIEEDIAVGTTTAGTTTPTWPGTCTGVEQTAEGTGKPTWLAIGPAVKGSITYATGVAAFTNSTGGALSLPTGETLTVNYTFCGWHTSCGTGLMDEWGDLTTHTWLGGRYNGVDPTSEFCLIPPPTGYAKYSSCVAGANVGAPSINSTAGSDLDAWQSQEISYYEGKMRSTLKTASNLPFMGMDFWGAWEVPGPHSILAGVAPNVDTIFLGGVDGAGSQPSDVLPLAWKYITQYTGDIPIGMQTQPVNQPDDAPYYCISYANYTTTGAAASISNTSRSTVGMGWYRLVNTMLFTPSFNGTYQGVLLNRWVQQDFQRIGQGMTTLRDNAYDGKEDSASTVTCDPVYAFLVSGSCGGEADVPQSPQIGAPNATCSSFGSFCTLTSQSGTISSQTLFVEFTYVTALGETKPSAETSTSLTANNVAVVNAVMGFPPGVTGINIYMSTTTGTETKQNASPIASGGQWVEPNSGLIAGASPPATDTSGIVFGDEVSYWKAANKMWLFNIWPNAGITAVP